MMKRNFYPGDEWLSYKIYCNRYISNKILLGPIKNVTTLLIKKNIINKWFFVRYEDPDFHIRLRLCLNSTDDILRVIRNIKNSLKAFLEEQQVWKLQIDTYQREIERYGGECTKSAERVFFHDSIFALDILKLTPNDSLLIVYGIAYINTLLNSFEMDDEQKLNFVKQSAQLYQKEFEIDSGDKRNLNLKYKLLQTPIKEVLTKKRDSNFLLLQEVFEKNVYILKSEIEDIKNCKTQHFYNILGSIIHMGINRLFYENQRFYEMICYDYLTKYCTTKNWLNE